MDLNMSTKMMQRPNVAVLQITEGRKCIGALAKFMEVSIEANECLKSAQAKIESLSHASNETLLTLKKQVEEAHEQIDSIRRERDDATTLMLYSRN